MKKKIRKSGKNKIPRRGFLLIKYDSRRKKISALPENMIPNPKHFSYKDRTTKKEKIFKEGDIYIQCMYIIHI